MSTSVPNVMPSQTHGKLLWREIVSAKGKSYYHNRLTKQTTWQRPSDLEMTIGLQNAELMSTNSSVPAGSDTATVGLSEPVAALPSPVRPSPITSVDSSVTSAAPIASSVASPSRSSVVYFTLVEPGAIGVELNALNRVVALIAGATADRLGIRVGDILTRIGRTLVSSLSNVAAGEVIRSAPRPVEIVFSRYISTGPEHQDWRRVIDVKTNIPYWWNHETREARWRDPTTSSTTAAAAAAATSSSHGHHNNHASSPTAAKHVTSSLSSSQPAPVLAHSHTGGGNISHSVKHSTSSSPPSTSQQTRSTNLPTSPSLPYSHLPVSHAPVPHTVTPTLTTISQAPTTTTTGTTASKQSTSISATSPPPQNPPLSSISTTSMAAAATMNQRSLLGSPLKSVSTIDPKSSAVTKMPHLSQIFKVQASELAASGYEINGLPTAFGYFPAALPASALEPRALSLQMQGSLWKKGRKGWRDWKCRHACTHRYALIYFHATTEGAVNVTHAVNILHPLGALDLRYALDIVGGSELLTRDNRSIEHDDVVLNTCIRITLVGHDPIYFHAATADLATKWINALIEIVAYYGCMATSGTPLHTRLLAHTAAAAAAAAAALTASSNLSSDPSVSSSSASSFTQNLLWPSSTIASASSPSSSSASASASAAATLPVVPTGVAAAALTNVPASTTVAQEPKLIPSSTSSNGVVVDFVKSGMIMSEQQQQPNVSSLEVFKSRVETTVPVAAPLSVLITTPPPSSLTTTTTATTTATTSSSSSTIPMPILVSKTQDDDSSDSDSTATPTLDCVTLNLEEEGEDGDDSPVPNEEYCLHEALPPTAVSIHNAGVVGGVEVDAEVEGEGEGGGGGPLPPSVPLTVESLNTELSPSPPSPILRIVVNGGVGGGSAATGGDFGSRRVVSPMRRAAQQLALSLTLGVGGGVKDPSPLPVSTSIVTSHPHHHHHTEVRLESVVDRIIPPHRRSGVHELLGTRNTSASTRMSQNNAAAALFSSLPLEPVPLPPPVEVTPPTPPPAAPRHLGILASVEAILSGSSTSAGVEDLYTSNLALREALKPLPLPVQAASSMVNVSQIETGSPRTISPISNSSSSPISPTKISLPDTITSHIDATREGMRRLALAMEALNNGKGSQSPLPTTAMSANEEVPIIGVSGGSGSGSGSGAAWAATPFASASLRAALALVSELPSRGGAPPSLPPSSAILAARIATRERSERLHYAYAHFLSGNTDTSSIDANHDVALDKALGIISRALQVSPSLPLGLCISLFSALNGNGNETGVTDSIASFVRFLRDSPLNQASASPLGFIRVVATTAAALVNTTMATATTPTTAAASIFLGALITESLAGWFEHARTAPPPLPLGAPPTPYPSDCLSLSAIVAAIVRTPPGGGIEAHLVSLLRALAHDSALAAVPAETCVAFALLRGAAGAPVARTVLLRNAIAPLLASALMEEQAAWDARRSLEGIMINDAIEAADDDSRALALATLLGLSAVAVLPAPPRSVAVAADTLLARWSALGAGVLDFVPLVRDAVISGATAATASSQGVVTAATTLLATVAADTDAASTIGASDDFGGLEILTSRLTSQLPALYARPKDAACALVLTDDWMGGLLPGLAAALNNNSSATILAATGEGVAEAATTLLLGASTFTTTPGALSFRALKLPDEGAEAVAGAVSCQYDTKDADAARHALGIFQFAAEVVGLELVFGADSQAPLRETTSLDDAKALIEAAKNLVSLQKTIDSIREEARAHDDCAAWMRATLDLLDKAPVA